MSKTKEQQPAYISRVHLKGYKSIRDLEIDFKAGLNIIIGPNGSGKTNFLEFLAEHILCFNELEFPYEANISFISEKDNQYSWAIKGTFNNEIPNNSELLLEERIFINDKEFKNENNLKTGKKIQFASVINMENFTFFHPIIIRFGNITGYPLLDEKATFTIDNHRQSVYGFKNTKSKISRGTRAFSPIINFNGIYSDLKEIIKNQGVNAISKDVFSSLLAISSGLITNLRRFSSIEDIRIREGYTFNKNDDLTNIDYLLAEFFVNRNWITWEMLSDGTKRIFHIISQVQNSTNNIFIEEPELGIHPDQLYLLMDFLKEQSKEKQIIITTHSPEVLNILEKDELDRIIVTRYDAEKGTQMHHLSPHKVKKGQMYMDKVGYLSNFWVHSNLEEYEAEEYEVE